MQSASCEFLKEAAFLRHNNLGNGHSLKSLSMLFINQTSLAKSLMATKSHEHFTGTWQTMWGRKGFSKSLVFTFVQLWVLLLYDGALFDIQEVEGEAICKLRSFFQHTPITYSMKNKQKMNPDAFSVHDWFTKQYPSAFSFVIWTCQNTKHTNQTA